MGAHMSTWCDGKLEDSDVCIVSMRNLNDTRLTTEPTDANPDLAGIGLIYVTISTCLCALLVTFGLVVYKGHGLFQSEEIVQKAMRNRHNENKTTLRNVWESILLGLSDQQLIIAPATLLAALINKDNWCSLSVYHYNVVCYCAGMAIITHMASLMAQSHYFQSRLLAGVRISLMIVTFVLFGLFITNRTLGNFPLDPGPQQTLLATCFTSKNSTIVDQIADIFEPGKSVSRGLWEYAVLCIFWIAAVVAALFHSAHIERKWQHVTSQRWSFGCCLLTVLLCFGLLGYTWHYLVELIDSMQRDDRLTSRDETKWGFGQLVPVFLLLVTVVAGLEANSDRKSGKPMRRGEREGQKHYESDEGHNLTDRRYDDN